MATAFFILSCCFLALLVFALIRPGMFVFWSQRKSRMNAAIGYGVALALSLSAYVVVKDTNIYQEKEQAPLPAFQPLEHNQFTGTISYRLEIEGEDSAQVSSMRNFFPSAITISIDGSRYRQDETGGFNAGSAIADFESGIAYLLDTAKKEYTPAKINNLEEAVNETLSRASQTKPVLVAQGEEEKIAGYNCSKYKVVSAHQLSETAAAYVWIAAIPIYIKKLQLATDTKRVSPPLPLLLAPEEGTVLKMTIEEFGLRSIYTATEVSMDKPAPSVFELPDAKSVLN